MLPCVTLLLKRSLLSPVCLYLAVSSSDADTIKWLESQGITMLSADNSTIVANTIENGQQLTLTGSHSNISVVTISDNIINNDILIYLAK